MIAIHEYVLDRNGNAVMRDPVVYGPYADVASAQLALTDIGAVRGWFSACYEPGGRPGDYEGGWTYGDRRFGVVQVEFKRLK